MDLFSWFSEKWRSSTTQGGPFDSSSDKWSLETLASTTREHILEQCRKVRVPVTHVSRNKRIRYIGPSSPRGTPGGGNGIFLYDDGSVYAGEVYGGQRNGQGLFVDARTNYVYEGWWKDDLRHGRGRVVERGDHLPMISAAGASTPATVTPSAGATICGVWEEGRPRSATRFENGSGTKWRETYTSLGHLKESHLEELNATQAQIETPSSSTTVDNVNSQSQSSYQSHVNESAHQPLNNVHLESRTRDTSLAIVAYPGTKGGGDDDSLTPLGGAALSRRSKSGTPDMGEDSRADKKTPDAAAMECLGAKMTDGTWRTHSSTTTQLPSSAAPVERPISNMTEETDRPEDPEIGTWRSAALAAAGYDPDQPERDEAKPPPGWATRRRRRSSSAENFAEGAPFGSMPENADQIVAWMSSTGSVDMIPEEVAQWSVDQVASWMRAKGFVPLTPTVREKRIDGRQLLGMKVTHSSLKTELGIDHFGMRARLISHLAALRTPKDPFTAADGTAPGFYETLHNIQFLVPFEELQISHALKSCRCGPELCPCPVASMHAMWTGRKVVVRVFAGRLVKPEKWMEYCCMLSQLRYPHLVMCLGVAVKSPDLHCVVWECLPHLSVFEVVHAPENQFHLPLAPPVLPLPPPGQPSEFSGLQISSNPEDGAEEQLKTQHCNHITSNAEVYLELCGIKPRNRGCCDMVVPLRKNSIVRELDSFNKHEDIISVARGIALGCMFLHERKILHGNLKSTNVLVDESGDVRLIDYGLAMVKDAFGPLPPSFCPTCIQAKCATCGEVVPITSLTIRPWSAGYKSPRWVPPEIARKILVQGWLGAEESEAADVYACGVILWEMLTHLVPYGRLSTPQTFTAVGISGLPLWDMSAPPELKTVVQLCTAADPNRRPSFASLLRPLRTARQKMCSSAEVSLEAFLCGEAHSHPLDPAEETMRRGGCRRVESPPSREDQPLGERRRGSLKKGAK